MHAQRTGIGVVIFPIILALVVTGCSRDGGSDLPTEPSVQPDAVSHDSTSAGTHSLFGIWNIYISTDDATVEIVPLRGLNFQCNVVNFLQPPNAPVHLIKTQIDFSLSDIPNGYIVIDVTFDHPFPGTKFCGFDVMGIIMDSHPGHQFTSDPEINYSRPPETLVLNPDGYTRWWNQPEFTTYGKLFGYTHGERAKGDFTCEHTLNPFKYYSDDIDDQDIFDPDPAARGFFSSVDPGINTRRFELQFQTPDGNPWWAFKYAVSASYVAPYETAVPPYTVADFPISANMPEAYKIDLIDNGSTAFYVEPNSLGGDLNLFIEVRDWQLDGTLSAVTDEIAGVIIESPTLFSNPVDLDLSAAELVPGNPTAVRFPVLIEDVTPSAFDNQLLLVTVLSGYPTTYEPQIPGITGFDFPDGPLAAYHIFEVPLSNQGGDAMQFAYSSDREGNYEVYLTDTIGSFEINLTNHPAFDYMNDFSPYGSILYFNSDRDGHFDVFALDMETMEITEITNDPGQHQYGCAVSPDGEWIVTVNSWSVIDKDIFRLKADGSMDKSEWINLTNTPGVYEHEMDWSPDGEKIVYYKIPSGNDIWMMDSSDGGNQHKIIAEPGDDHGPTFHPGGDIVLYSSKQSGSSGIYYYSFSDDMNYTYIDTNLDEGGGEFSQDGQYVIFPIGEPSDIYYASFPELGPGEPIPVVTYSSHDSMAVWRPSGGPFIEELDHGHINSNHSLAIDSSGNPHIFYKKLPDSILGYTWFDGDTWQYQPADSEIWYSEGLDLDSNDEPHIIFSTDSLETVSYGHLNGTLWEIQTVYTPWPGTFSSIRIDSDDHPHLAIHGGGGGGQGIWHKWHNGTDWLEEHFLNGCMVNPSIDLDSNDYAHISHVDNYNPCNLYHSHFDGVSWDHPIVTSPTAMSNLRIDSADNIHIAVEFGQGGGSSNTLGYCFFDGADWTLTTVDDTPSSKFPSIALDSNDLPHISYVGGNGSILKYARFDGVDWHVQTIIDLVTVTSWSSIGIRPGDKAVITYQENHTVMCVWLD